MAIGGGGAGAKAYAAPRICDFLLQASLELFHVKKIKHFKKKRKGKEKEKTFSIRVPE